MDEYKRTIVRAREWGRKFRKYLSRNAGKATLKRNLVKLPTEPELYPAEIEEIEHRALCKERNLCEFCGSDLGAASECGCF